MASIPTYLIGKSGDGALGETGVHGLNVGHLQEEGRPHRREH